MQGTGSDFRHAPDLTVIVDLYSSPCGCMEVPSLVPGSKEREGGGRGGGEKSAWCPLLVHVSSSHGNLHTTKIMTNFSLPAERPHCMLPVGREPGYSFTGYVTCT